MADDCDCAGAYADPKTGNLDLPVGQWRSYSYNARAERISTTAVAGSGVAAAGLALSGMAFTDPLLTGLVAKAAHVNELRGGVR